MGDLLGLLLLAILIVGGISWWLASKQSLNRNERVYLRSRGYDAGETVPEKPGVMPDSRLRDLLDSLDDITPYSRERAAEELSLLCQSGMRDERMFAPLVAALDDKNAAVRAAVAVALGHLGDQRAISSLSQVVEKDASSHARSQARRALEKLAGQPVEEEPRSS
ncbi:MAG TPA: HEAT repeat domain-containing protein [Blastocatellia bacterium]|nr:HEAT repeat domain-containing protein [Blastocatellia bacterium]